MPQPYNLFTIYAREDARLLSELLSQLKPLEISGRIKVWSDREINPRRSFPPPLVFFTYGMHTSSIENQSTQNIYHPRGVGQACNPPFKRRVTSLSDGDDRCDSDTLFNLTDNQQKMCAYRR